MPIYAIWFVAALALLVLELASTTFFSIFLAVGAFAAGLLAFFVPDSPIWLQATVAIAVALLGVVVGRPFLSRRLRRQRRGAADARASTVASSGSARSPSTRSARSSTRATSAWPGETWLAFSDDHQTIPQGAPVIVTDVRGTTLAVRPASGSAIPES